MGKPVLAVEAEPESRHQLVALLRQLGYAPVAVGSVDEALTALATTQFDLSVVAMDLNGTDGLDFLRRLRVEGGDLSAGSIPDPGHIIMLFETADTKRIGEAATLGVDDFVPKPVKPEDLENAIKGVSHGPRRGWGRLQADNFTLRLEQEVALWRSHRMQEASKIIQQAAQVDITVLISGETGTGKDLVARSIHQLSFRQSKPFVKVNCAAVPRELLESELFGHERGAFTGAHQLKLGKFELANRGTIFLDEIGDLHPALQGKLLHVLQDGEFSRVGGKSPVKVDVRIIAATNQDLEKAVAAGHFREDLFYRLNVVQIVVPPLRERAEEIPLLANYFAQRYSHLFNRHGFSIPAHVMDRLVRHTYPGNVRELENIVKRMIVLNDPFMTPKTLPQAKASASGNGPGAATDAQTLSLKDIAREAALAAEREAIGRVLTQTHWNRVKAAKLLKISYRALLYKIKHVGLEPERPSVRSVL